jgi:lipid-binding SYLF domain-containing protein
MEESRMSCSSARRTTLAAAVLLTGIGFASAVQAETCSISFTVIKAGFVVGGQGGSGSMRCANRSYPISIGGLSYGFMIGASETRFRGSATFNGSPRSVAGVYGAGGAGAAIGRGAQAIVLVNQNGAVLALTGYQRGLQINADLSGLALSMR